MGNNIIKKINFKDMKKCIKNDNYIIINTMDIKYQDYVIKNTIDINMEVELLNKYINNNKNINIIIYGLNSSDNSIYKKYNQLINLGFKNVYIYPGGMFEWLLLQEVYGIDEFETNKYVFDLLKFKGDCLL
jgi:hypothetical protein